MAYARKTAHKLTRNTITITFGEVAENHVGMQQLGSCADKGFSKQDLVFAQDVFKKKGFKCELLHLNNYLIEELYGLDVADAYVLIVRKGVNFFLSPNNLLFLKIQLDRLDWDTKAFMYGRVVNKRARYNLCFDDKGQEPDYENRKGSIIAFSDVPLLNHIRGKLESVLGPKASGLKAEGNMYYDIEKCGIGFHGDGERKRVIAFRLGESMPLDYQWFFNRKSVGKRVELVLDDGDLYIMNEKATGNDWKKWKQVTLRHAAGAKKFRTIKIKKVKNDG